VWEGKKRSAVRVIVGFGFGFLLFEEKITLIATNDVPGV
jgi:hypothetical protein